MTRATRNKHCELFPNHETETQVVALFKMLGITRINGEYSGSGDSSDLSELTFEGNTNFDRGQKYKFTIQNTSYGKENELVEEEFSIEELGQHLMWEAISKIGRDGFYNNEGGYGAFRVDFTVSPVQFAIDHYDNVTTTERTMQGWLTGTKDNFDPEGFDDRGQS